MSQRQNVTLHDKWYSGHGFVWLLAPFALIFYFVSAIRRLLFKVGIKKAFKADVPVIVVGNISVGGNGKTPVVLALASYYQARGIKVGILSRGYGAKSQVYPRLVCGDDNADEVGDEPRLLAIRSQCDVVIDPVRARGAAYLTNELKCELIICDDGLQHYALHRDVEIVVMDDRKLGSGYLLPMGPLREGQWRLETVDALVHNSRSMPTFDSAVSPQFLMTLVPGEFTSVLNRMKTTTLEEIKALPCSAIAGIGAPQRFFNQLKGMGINVSHTYPLNDHHAISSSDIPDGRVLMTEKDAVKAAPFAHHDCWFLPVSAHMAPDFFNLINVKLANAGLTIHQNGQE
ncbi:tetraacyldisaccharide 4'-kinase [Alteromonas sp. KUL106]|uniref:tetraacyldisaccharide 4'-kinase n=1 Tax=Alteromonas sp. KUL106 TaxID=2480799 RepID=UPI0012E6E0C7|nr:tetraacyldisaccharide 4'-kinase [Alteromonas sp. KUL106]GFD68474.1 tetraacyldisaccharide 4'-kinase [Alteromonas sp. KUL106]